jgi:ribosome-associated protein
MTDQNDYPEDDGEYLSKTRRKKDMHALQELGEKLTTLPPSLLAKCNLPPELQNAIDEYKRIPPRRGARKRQLQFIGRVMRDVDPEPIQQVLDEQGQQSELAKRHFHHLEILREQLLDGDQATLDALIRDYSDTDIQYMRALIRQAQKEKADNKAPSASRKLFAYLRELTEA